MVVKVFDFFSVVKYMFYVFIVLIIIKVGYFFHNDSATDIKINLLLDDIQKSINDNLNRSTAIKPILLKIVQLSYR